MSIQRRLFVASVAFVALFSAVGTAPVHQTRLAMFGKIARTYTQQIPDGTGGDNLPPAPQPTPHAPAQAT